MTDPKIERERRFHNQRFSYVTDPREHLNKWYTAIRHGAERQNRLVLDYASGKDVLEYGCADGWLSIDELKLPEKAHSLTGIDISDVAIQKATARAGRGGFWNAQFLTMDAEATTFPENSFDVVFGRGILHHLELQKCCSEISRILRDNGVAIFCEPMGHNPLINLYRRRTPDIRTVDEHPFLMTDFITARRYFTKVDTAFYGLFSVASVFLDRTASGIPYRLGRVVDDLILQAPIIGRYAWFCLMVCRK